MSNTQKILTVGIPAYKAEDHIRDCISSIMIQTIRDNISIIIAKDNPSDNYDFLIKDYPKLDIKILDCEKNTGPGLARQRCLEAATTDWITFIDADDIFITPFALESLIKGVVKPEVIEVQAPFCQEVQNHPKGIRMVPRNDPGHPWVFGRMYNVNFLKKNEIGFTKLRAMEDGELNWKIRMTIEGSPFLINIVNDPVYLWRTGSEHSITRMF